MVAFWGNVRALPAQADDRTLPRGVLRMGTVGWWQRDPGSTALDGRAGQRFPWWPHRTPRGHAQRLFLGKDLPKETFLATGAAVACGVDITRIAVYVQLFQSLGSSIPWSVVGAGIAGALVGLWAGRIGLRKMPVAAFRKIIGIALMGFGLGLASGVIC